MPNFYASNYPDPTKAIVNAVDQKGARLRSTQTDITPATAPVLADVLYLMRIPTNARMIDLGKISYGAFGGTSAVSMGFYHPTMTAAQVTAGSTKLWNAQSIVAAGSRQFMFGVALADLGKRAWELAGLTKDPGGEMDIIMTVSTATTAAARIYGDGTFITD